MSLLSFSINIGAPFAFLIIVFICIRKTIKAYKEDYSLNAKTLFWGLIVLFLLPFTLFFLEKYDFAANINLLKDYELNRWFNFLSEYFAAIVGSTIGAVALIIMTRLQYESECENINEQNRINNLPLLSYTIDVVPYNVVLPFVDITDDNDDNNVFVKIAIKNIGLNSVRKCYIECNARNIQIKKYSCKLDEQDVIEKTQEKYLLYKFPIRNNYKLKFVIKYQDVLFNWYEQIVEVEISDIMLRNKGSINSKIDCKIVKNVQDEKVVSEEDLKLYEVV